MAQTANYNLEKPDVTRDVDEEFYQLQETLDLLDSILAALQTAVNGKSATGHTHAISDVINLASELAAKMPASTTFKLDDLTDVSGADGAPNNYVLVKSALGWLPSSALAALGTHGHLISEITGLVAALADKADAAATTTALAGKADKTTTVAGAGLASGGGDLSTNRTITVTKATSAQAQARVQDDVALTPLTGDEMAAARDARFMHVRDQKSQGSGGGSYTAGATVTRDLNTTVVNNITGASLNVSNGQVTLPAGVYDIRVEVPSYNGARVFAALRRVSDSVILARSGSTDSGNSTNISQTSIAMNARLTLASSTTFDVRMRGSNSNTGGLGLALNLSGEVEIYTEMMIWKVD